MNRTCCNQGIVLGPFAIVDLSMLCIWNFFLEMASYTDEPESYSSSISQWSSRVDQIPGIGDGEMPVVPAETQDSTVTGQHNVRLWFCRQSNLFLTVYSSARNKKIK